MKTFKVNGKEYNAVTFDFNTVCDMEDLGFSLQDLGKKNTKAIRAYFALCSGLSEEKAGKEIEKHIINGGKITDISNVLNSEMDKSDFFRALIQAEETEVAESQTEKTEKK